MTKQCWSETIIQLIRENKGQWKHTYISRSMIIVILYFEEDLLKVREVDLEVEYLLHMTIVKKQKGVPITP